MGAFRFLCFFVAFVTASCNASFYHPRTSFRIRNQRRSFMTSYYNTARQSLPQKFMIPGSESQKEPTRITTAFDSFRKPPHIALITETNACDTDEHVEQTLRAVAEAVSTNKISLVVVRVSPPDGGDTDGCFQTRVINLAKRISDMRNYHPQSEDPDSKPGFFLVVNNNVDAALKSGADGVHVKENDVQSIPTIRSRFQLQNQHYSAPGLKKQVIIGTSAHSIQSALATSKNYAPDYFFVGTCFLTSSHPEKTQVEQLEGPELPGLVLNAISADIARKIGNASELKRPLVLAIGGIDENNCAIPVLKHGSDGVAVIRAIMQAHDPAGVTKSIAAALSAKPTCP